MSGYMPSFENVAKTVGQICDLKGADLVIRPLSHWVGESRETARFFTVSTGKITLRYSAVLRKPPKADTDVSPTPAHFSCAPDMQDSRTRTTSVPILVLAGSLLLLDSHSVSDLPRDGRLRIEKGRHDVFRPCTCQGTDQDSRML